MKPRKKLVLHIGQGKTGTSAVQAVLFRNAAILARNGVCYPEWFGFRERRVLKHHNRLAMGILYSDYRTELTSFLDAIHRDDSPTIVISGETLFVYPERGAFVGALGGPGSGWTFGTDYQPWSSERSRAVVTRFAEDVRALLPPADEYRVVVLLRRQDLWLESLYNQDIKAGHVWCDVAQLERYYANSLHYDRVLASWENVFGKNSIVVRVYEQGQLPGGAVDVFLRAAGLDVVKNQLAIPPGLPNSRLTRRWLAFRRATNGLLSSLPEPLRRRANRLIRRVVVRANHHGRGRLFESFNLMSEDERLSFMQKYEQGNAHVARHYLGRSDGRLFLDRLSGRDADRR